MTKKKNRVTINIPGDRSLCVTSIRPYDGPTKVSQLVPKQHSHSKQTYSGPLEKKAALTLPGLDFTSKPAPAST
jgi:hypothetical protein